MYNYVKNLESVTHNPEKYKNIIYGIIDTNSKLNQILSGKEYTEIVNKMNANHLKIISNYLNFYFLYDSKNFIKLAKEVRMNNRVVFLLSNSEIKCLALRKKISILLFKNKNIKLLYYYTAIINKIT